MSDLQSDYKGGHLPRLLTMLLCFGEAVLLVIFIVGDISGGYRTVWLKYASVLICLAASSVTVLLRHRRCKSDSLLALAEMLVTATADVFLLVTGSHYELGTALFCVVQVICFIRVTDSYRRLAVSAILRFAAFTAATAVLIAVEMMSVLNLLAAFSFVNLSANAVSAVIAKNKITGAKLLAAGLVLFWLCDLSVGLYNIGVSEPVFGICGVAMWSFYLPSQMLIVLSAAAGGASGNGEIFSKAKKKNSGEKNEKSS